MNEPCLLPVKPGSLSESDKAALREAGIVVIEHESPSELRLLRPTYELDSSALFLAAMKALNTNRALASEAREAFAVHVLAALNAHGAA